MSILETKVSWFKTTTDTNVQPPFKILDFIKLIKGDKYKEKIDQLRAGDKEVKRYLPTIAFHGQFEESRKAANFIEASGLIIIDIDDVDKSKIEEIKQEIIDSYDSVLATMVSPSGDGIKVLYYVEQDMVTKDNYRAIGKEITLNFTSYGNVDFLSVTDTLILTHDPNIIVNENAQPDFIHIKEEARLKGNLEDRDKNIPLWDDAEDFFGTVLDQEISEKTNSNFHYIQVSMLDLAKFGFTHPEHDLSFIVNFSESHFKYSKGNQNRFKQIAELAKTYPQTRWAYNTTSGNQETKRVDYSNFIDDEAGMSNYDSDDEEDTETPQKEKEEEPDTGLVNYATLYDKVIETINEGDRVGREISLQNFADVFRFKGTGILTVTGIPGHGKTEFVDAITLDLARLYDESSLIVGFEQSAEEHIIKICRKMIGANITCKTWWREENEIIFRRNYDFVTKRIQHINTTKTGGDINELLIKSAEWVQAQRRAGNNPRYLVLDPFNMISIKGKFSGHEKVEEILRQLTHFSHQMGILVILIAHPFKMKKDEKTGEYDVPDFYSVKGSSAFFEMSYHGLTIYRTNGMVLVKVLKVKQNNLGDRDAEVWFMYDKSSGRYIPCDENGSEIAGDHRDKDWLKKIK
jgi:hypothetical protein